MQTVLFKIWTQIANSISYDNDNCYITSAPNKIKPPT